MIQYRYQRSEGSGFGSYISEKDPEKADKYSSVFNKLSAIVNQKEICFSYLVDEGIAYFMQTEVQTNVNNHGMAGEINGLPDSYPVEYINKIGSSFVREIKQPLNDEKLPLEKNRLILSVSRELQPVFAEIVDTLLYTDKKIILIANDSKLLQNYLFVISLLLPKDYMKHIGFVYNAETMPYILSSGSSLADSIRIIATKEKSMADFGGDEFYVADVTGSRPVLPDTQLHSYGKLIKLFENDLKRGSANELSVIIRGMYDAFGSDGNVDYENIDIKTVVAFYERETTPENAKALLKARLMPGGKDLIAADDLVRAIIAFIGESSADTETSEYINRIRNEDATLDRIITITIGKDTLLKLNAGKPVTQEQIKNAKNYLSGEQDEEWQETFNTLNERFDQKIFELLAQAYIDTKNRTLLAKIAEYCNIDKVIDNIDEIDNGVFGYIKENCEDNIQLLAAVLFSAYFDPENGDRITTKSRPSRLQKYVNDKYSYSKEPVTEAEKAEEQNCIKQKIDFLLILKKEIRSKYELVTGKTLPSYNDFTIVDDGYIGDLVNSLNFNVCLEYFKENGKQIAEYFVVYNDFVGKLTNAILVEREIINDEQIKSYETFLKSQSEDYVELKRILSYKKDYNKVKNTIFKARSDYTIGLYKCMPLEMRVEVARVAEHFMESRDYRVKYIVKRKHDGINSRLSDLRNCLNGQGNIETKEQERLYFEWRTIIDSILAVNKKKQKVAESSFSGKDVNYTLLSLLKSIFCAVIAIAILSIVPLVGSYLSQENFIDRLGDYINIFHFVAVLWTFVIHFILRMRAYKKSNKGGSKYDAEVKTVWYYTFLTALLPILLYIASYIVYATVVPSNFTF